MQIIISMQITLRQNQVTRAYELCLFIRIAPTMDTNSLYFVTNIVNVQNSINC